jgi:type IV secretion system protein TrbL
MLDTITLAFVTAIQSGTATLTEVSLPLLAVLATMAFYIQLSPLLASGGAGAGEALASTVFTLLKVGIFYWLLKNLVPLATAALLTFFQWGSAVGGGTVTPATLLHPSSFVAIGQKAAAPLADAIDRLGGFWFTKKPGVMLVYLVSEWLILLAFWLVAVHVVLTLIEFYFGVLVATVLVPFGVLAPTAFFAEFAIGWVTGGLVRVLLTAAIMGVATPLFQLVSFPTAGGDPTADTALTVALSSGLFALLAWVIPGRAASIAGRGVSLALHAGTVLATAAGGGRFLLMAQGAIRGISTLVQGARSAPKGT